MPFYITCPSCKKPVANNVAICDGCGVDLTKGAQYSADTTSLPVVPSTPSDSATNSPTSTSDGATNSPAPKKNPVYQNVAGGLFMLAMACAGLICWLAIEVSGDRSPDWTGFFIFSFLPFVIGVVCALVGYAYYHKE